MASLSMIYYPLSESQIFSLIDSNSIEKVSIHDNTIFIETLSRKYKYSIQDVRSAKTIINRIVEKICSGE